MRVVLGIDKQYSPTYRHRTTTWIFISPLSSAPSPPFSPLVVRGLEPEDWTCPFANVRLGFLGAVSLVGL